MAVVMDHVAHNYDPLPLTVVRAEGVWLEDREGVRYLDLLAGYSATSFGHRHPAIVAAAHQAIDCLTLTGRAVGQDQLDDFCAELADLCHREVVLPMNTGAEAVETAIKVSRRWGYQVKGVESDTATIVAFEGNFHGRTTTIVGFSSDPVARTGFGPFTPGFRIVPFGDLDAVAAAVDASTVAVLVEPVQGEAGVIIPPRGFLAGLRDLCAERHVLLVADEVQSGLGRTGTTFACDHEDVVPDVYVVGKALGGGIVPVSAVVADHEVLDVLTPGSHGSTFGGNPLACRVARAVLALLRTGEYQARATELGYQLRDLLRTLPPDLVEETRSIGLWAGIDLAPGMPPARRVSELLLERRVFAKDVHGRTLRISPPLVITKAELEWAVEQLARTLELAASEMGTRPRPETSAPRAERGSS